MVLFYCEGVWNILLGVWRDFPARLITPGHSRFIDHLVQNFNCHGYIVGSSDINGVPDSNGQRTEMLWSMEV